MVNKDAKCAAGDNTKEVILIPATLMADHMPIWPIRVSFDRADDGGR